MVSLTLSELYLPVEWIRLVWGDAFSPYFHWLSSSSIRFHGSPVGTPYRKYECQGGTSDLCLQSQALGCQVKPYAALAHVRERVLEITIEVSHLKLTGRDISPQDEIKGFLPSHWQGHLTNSACAQVDKSCLYFIFKISWPCHAACGIFVPGPGNEPSPLALEEWGLDHGACTWEVLTWVPVSWSRACHTFCSLQACLLTDKGRCHGDACQKGPASFDSSWKQSF